MRAVRKNEEEELSERKLRKLEPATLSVGRNYGVQNLTEIKFDLPDKPISATLSLSVTDAQYEPSCSKSITLPELEFHLTPLASISNTSACYNFEKTSDCLNRENILKNNAAESDEPEVDIDTNFVNELPCLPEVLQTPNSIPDTLLVLEQNLSKKLADIKFKAPVEYIYNPIEYAFDVHFKYVHTYCQNTKKILFLGINPGPWGMSQTGVPFGEISMVRDWLKISGNVGSPYREHPNRKVIGFRCTRREVSGFRFWSLFRDLCENPENFFRNTYVHNYCPLAFMDSKARNITPGELKANEQTLQLRELLKLCDEALEKVIQLLKIEIIIGIGRYAEERAKIVLKNSSMQAKVVYFPHPSPRAAKNKNWSDVAKSTLKDLNLLAFFTK